METITRLNGGLLIVDRHGGTAELDAAEVAALRMVINAQLWRLNATVDLCYGDLYVLSSWPGFDWPYDVAGFSDLASYLIRTQPKLEDNDILAIPGLRSAQVWPMLQRYRPQ